MDIARRIPGLAALAMVAWPAVLSPWYSPVARASVRSHERREPAAWPAVHGPADLVDTAVWAQASAFVADSIPLRGPMIRLRHNLAVHVLGEQRVGLAGIGDDGWLYYMPTFGLHMGSVEQVGQRLALVERSEHARTGGARLILLPAPDKHTIVPEHLSPLLRRMKAASAPAQARFESWFREPGPPQRVDTWTPLRAAHARAGQPVYERTGAHFTPFGAMIFAESLIEAVRPGQWDPGAVTRLGEQDVRFTLQDLAGFSGPPETQAVYEVRRPGVTLERATHGGRPLAGDRPDPGQPDWYIAAERFRSSGDGLIPGRTVIIHDSFVGVYLRPSLRQYFEDVTFVHFDTLNGGDLLGALRDFDLAVIASHESTMSHRFGVFFRPFQPTGRVLELSETGFGEP